MPLLLLAQDELLRLPSTRRGLVSLAGFLLIWVATLNYGILPAARFFAGARDSGLTDLLLPRLGVNAWQQWPAPELAVYWVISLYLMPLLALYVSADQTASDRSRGTLRYYGLRCSRLEIFLGRFIGQLVLMSLAICLTLASVLLVIASNSSELIVASLASAPLILFNLVLVVMPCIALMAVFSVLAGSARQALLYAVIGWLLVGMLVSVLQSRFGPMTALDWLLPGSQTEKLRALADWRTLDYAIVPLAHTLFLLLIGGLLMQRRDL